MRWLTIAGLITASACLSVDGPTTRASGREDLADAGQSEFTSQQNMLTAPDVRAAVTQQVSNFLRLYEKNSRSLDTKALSSMYSCSKEFFWVDTALDHIYGSCDEMAEALSVNLSGVKAIKLDINRIRIVPVSEVAAVTFFHYRYRITTERSRQVVEGMVTATAVRENGAWKFLVGHSTVN